MFDLERLDNFFNEYKKDAALRDRSIKEDSMRLSLFKEDNNLYRVLNDDIVTRGKLRAAIDHNINYIYLSKNIKFSLEISEMEGSFYLSSKGFWTLKDKEALDILITPLSLSFEDGLFSLINDFDIKKKSPARALFSLLLDRESISFTERIKRLSDDSLYFIWGPPGTGKTTEIVRKAKEMKERGERILISASTNLSLDDIHARLKEAGVDAIRIGRNGIRRERDVKRTLARVKKGSVILMTVAKTLIEIENIIKEKKSIFSTILLDEAGVVKDRYLIALSLLSSKSLYIYGDHKQLAPVDEVQDSSMIFDLLNLRTEDEGLKSPYFKMLQKEYRMNSEIDRFISNTFYSGRLIKAKGRDEKLEKTDLDKIFSRALNLLDLSNFSLYTYRYKKSYLNFITSYFAVAVALLYRKMLGDKVTLCICTPYKEDASLIKTIANELFKKDERKNLTIDTVHAFQGKEVDIMIMSFSDSNPLEKLTMLTRSYDKESFKGPSDRLLNVAISRSRIKFILVGDFQFLLSHAEKGTSLEKLLNEIYLSPLKERKKLKAVINTINSLLNKRTEIGLFGDAKDKSKLIDSSSSSWLLRKEFWEREIESFAFASSPFSMTALRSTLIENARRYNKEITLVHGPGRFKLSDSKSPFFKKVTAIDREIPFSYTIEGDDFIYGAFYAEDEKERGKSVPFIVIKSTKELKKIIFR